MAGRLSSIGAGLFAVLGLLFILAQFIFWGGTSLGVVRESCVDLERSTQSRLEIDTHWTYILLPPGPLANIDPAGTCVRNSPLREGLSAIGIWELASPEQQVREHVEEQLRETRR